jgi:hypothetical protein
MALFWHNTLRYFDEEEHEKVLSCVNNFLSLYKNVPRNVIFLDIYMMRAITLQKQAKYEEALTACDDYFRLYKLYAEDRLSTIGIGIVQITYTEPEKYAAVKAMHSELLSKTGRLKFALSGENSAGIQVQVVTKSGAALTPPDPDAPPPPVHEQNYSELLDKFMAATEKPDAEDMALFEAVLSFAGRLPWDKRAILYGNYAKHAGYTNTAELKKALKTCESEHVKRAFEYLIEEGL